MFMKLFFCRRTGSWVLVLLVLHALVLTGQLSAGSISGQKFHDLNANGVKDAGEPGLAGWRKSLFTFLSRNARPATAFFGLPPDRVVELGMQVEL